MRKLYIIPLYLTVCCGQHELEDYTVLPDTYYSEPKTVEVYGFEEYIESFESDSMWYNIPVKIDNLIIRFEKIEQPEEYRVLGNCTTQIGKTPIIRVEPTFWPNMSDTQKHILMYHELGHCILRQKHRPNSIMSSFILHPSVYLSNKDYYDNELFNN